MCLISFMSCTSASWCFMLSLACSKSIDCYQLWKPARAIEARSFNACPMRLLASSMSLPPWHGLSSGNSFFTMPCLLLRYSAMSSILFQLFCPLIPNWMLILSSTTIFLFQTLFIHGHTTIVIFQQCHELGFIMKEKVAWKKVEFLSILVLVDPTKVSMVGCIIFTTFPGILYDSSCEW